MGVILGGVVHNNRHYFTRLFKKQGKQFSYKRSILVSRYTAGSPLFIDRSYYDQIGDKRLEGLFQILTTRHRQGLIVIKEKNPLTVYRLVSESNENHIFDEYKETDIRVKVLGSSSVHTKVLKKNFPKGIVSLAAGGPVSASPILISVVREAFPDFGFEVISN